eukprot:TRINITY_DN30109_c0_g1_i3.p1 TRINITY_DN30109_c0_g1~~TRINITY_DN30109_c0_g1_i3.p1  ORF type:complete len:109 (+),score=13.78 TRINITY_DN30109_c0_g1_i3:332-658(+)
MKDLSSMDLQEGCNVILLDEKKTRTKNPLFSIKRVYSIARDRDSKSPHPIHAAKSNERFQVRFYEYSVIRYRDGDPSPSLRYSLSTEPKIGRAVQQECRDRSRMPSSA